MSDAGSGTTGRGRDDRKIFLFVAALVVLAVGIGLFSSGGGGGDGGGRDDEAYRNGRFNASMAENLLKAGEDLNDGGPDTPTEACEVVFDTDEKAQSMDREDWLAGCTDQIRDNPGASPFDPDGPPMSSTSIPPEPPAVTSAPPVNPSPARPTGQLDPTAQAILSARLHDCIKRVNGQTMTDGRQSVTVALASCAGADATDVVRAIHFTDEQPPCSGVWLRNRDVSPAKVLCIEPLQ